MKNRPLVKRALRLLGVIGSGREPSAPQAADTLEAFQAVVNAMAPTLGGPWIEQEVTEDVTAEENDRIRVNSTDPITVTIPISTQGVERVVDTCGCVTVIERCSNSRAPRDMAKVFITDVYGSIDPLLYLYRADLALWVQANAITLDGDCPFGAQYAQGLAAMIAEAIAPEFDQPVPPKVTAMAAQGRLAMLSRYDAPRQPVQAEYF